MVRVKGVLYSHTGDYERTGPINGYTLTVNASEIPDYKVGEKLVLDYRTFDMVSKDGVEAHYKTDHRTNISVIKVLL